MNEPRRGDTNPRGCLCRPAGALGGGGAFHEPGPHGPGYPDTSGCPPVRGAGESATPDSPHTRRTAMPPIGLDTSGPQGYSEPFAYGPLAQLARAPARHAGGHWFKSSTAQFIARPAGRFFGVRSTGQSFVQHIRMRCAGTLWSIAHASDNSGSRDIVDVLDENEEGSLRSTPRYESQGVAPPARLPAADGSGSGWSRLP
jgi:hypothetical protein